MLYLLNRVFSFCISLASRDTLSIESHATMIEDTQSVPNIESHDTLTQSVPNVESQTIMIEDTQFVLVLSHRP